MINCRKFLTLFPGNFDVIIFVAIFNDVFVSKSEKY